jgi:peroxidase
MASATTSPTRNGESRGPTFVRLAPAAYTDGIDSPNLQGDQSARVISNILNNQADPATGVDLATVDQNSLSDFGYAFGQFMDHDLDLTPNGGASDPIEVAAGDPIGPDPLPFTRSLTDPATGTSTSNPAQQFNECHFLFRSLADLRLQARRSTMRLRTGQDGLLKTSPGNMLPFDNSTYFTPAQIAALNIENDSQAVPTSDLFAAGDRRVNENLEMTTLETLFVRNHNLIAEKLKIDHPTWTDEQLFEEARKLNIAEYQSIIYNEWIPAVLGANALPAYTGYKSNVDAAISNEFATVAFRFGHSLVSQEIERNNNQGNDIADVSPNGADIPLSEDFFDPNLLNVTGAVDPLTGTRPPILVRYSKAEADGDSEGQRYACCQRHSQPALRQRHRRRTGSDRPGYSARPRQRHSQLQRASRRSRLARGHQFFSDQQQSNDSERTG